ncbi:hypothetical protein KJ616_00855 [Patescibacteria group bacterium]|nr:hypothetical protein [Patescibacteria group bacterium]
MRKTKCEGNKRHRKGAFCFISSSSSLLFLPFDQRPSGAEIIMQLFFALLNRFQRKAVRRPTLNIPFYY